MGIGSFDLGACVSHVTPSLKRIFGGILEITPNFRGGWGFPTEDRTTSMTRVFHVTGKIDICNYIVIILGFKWANLELKKSCEQTKLEIISAKFIYASALTCFIEFADLPKGEENNGGNRPYSCTRKI